ncbi:hypothetical protein [Fuscibacter oryzae]|uniref:Uncharacterized protein n=1 Tax=Fuscibacter oryzae TaxID=2803939 RepID=A0A8J7MQ75_9RHOB|nr:hypothetical protein [Fuscibacter oryzae]MBL4927778.1 hypothetical protein [Fuscibacter oryzae]
MTKTRQKRDNSYYLDRLRIDHPGIYADFQAGKFKNASEALIKAGLRKPKTALDALHSAWAKATTAERVAFKAMIGCAPKVSTTSFISPGVSQPTTPASTPRPIHQNRYLTPEAADDIRAIMARRGLKNGDVMRELGFNPLNASLGMALNRNTQIKEPLLKALEGWIVSYRA